MYYFAYGSNMDVERVIERGITFTSRERGVLEGYKLLFNKIAKDHPGMGYANIVPNSNLEVEGIVYEIPDEDISKLDGHEGFPVHYKRIELKVKLDSGSLVNAVAYIANKDKVGEGLLPTKEYMNHLLKGKDLLSESYYKKLEEFYNNAV